MTAFLLVGAIGVLLLLVSLLFGDHVDALDSVFDLGGDWFSGAALAGFLGTLGFGGALAYDATGSATVGIVVGVVAGVVIGALVGWTMAKLRGNDSGEIVRTSALAWREATVVSAIPADGYGEISLVVSGHLTKLNARSPEALDAGTPVIITAVLSPTSVSVEAL